MELEQLKEIWTSFDRRMQQQDGLNTTIIREMLIQKSDRALSRMINYNYFGIIVCIVIFPVLVWCWTVGLSLNFIGRFMVPIALVFMFFCIVMGILQLKQLHRINFSQPVNENMYRVQKISLFNKRYLLISYIFASVYILVIIVLTLIFVRIAPWRWWIAATAISVGILLAVWEYKRMYRRNIDSIMSSLEKLKELEELEDTKS